YLLHVTNWTGTVYGFTIDLSSSTATLYDDIPPSMDSLTSQVNCQSFDSLRVLFDEDIVCSNIQAGDFRLTGPSGTHTITSASGLNCGTTTDEVVIYFTPAVTQVGNYELTVKPGAGYIEDLCGNLDTLDTISFTFDGIIEAVLNPTHLTCFQECNGEIDLDVIGGAAPFTYAWSGGLPSDTIHDNLCSGTYTVTVTDDIGCEAIEDIVLNQPTDINTVIQSTESVSCPNTANCDGGAVVSSTGGVGSYTYQWSSGEVGESASQLCADSNVVYTTDANGCRDTLDVIIGVPDSIITTGYGDSMICVSNTAVVTAAAIGGTPPFNYIWTANSLNSTVISTSQSMQVTPDVTTTYYVKTIDDRGCIGDTSKVLVKVRDTLGLIYDQPDTICPYDTIPITLTGTGGDSIYTFSWSTGTFGNEIIVSPDEPTWYAVTISDVCGTPAFKDSIFVQVGGYSAINAEITVEDDSICKGESLYLIARGSGGFNGPDEYVYEWGHTNDINPIQFVRPNQTREYNLTISDLCLSEPGVFTSTIYVGLPETPILEASPKEICGPSEVIVSIPNFNPKSSYTLSFDGNVFDAYDADSLVQQMNDPGCYPAGLDVVTEYGCASSVTYNCITKMLRQPSADFQQGPYLPTNTNPFVTLRNTSVDDDSWFWIIDRDTTHNEDDIRFEIDLKDSSELVTLVVTNTDGCHDTISKNIAALFETLLYYPNSFSPNGDGLNDEFKVNGEEISLVDFSLVIYDRWGEQVFRSNNPNRAWDGRFLDGDLVPAGSYPFIFRYRDHQNELRVIRDNIIIANTGVNKGLR
ncbi:MAG: gliding motility-associated C-terminal domain-containing protein, partial [Salibacteraceae bacterium]